MLTARVVRFTKQICLSRLNSVRYLDLLVEVGRKGKQLRMSVSKQLEVLFWSSSLGALGLTLTIRGAYPLLPSITCLIFHGLTNGDGSRDAKPWVRDSGTIICTLSGVYICTVDKASLNGLTAVFYFVVSCPCFFSLS